LKITTLMLGELATNCYVVTDEKTGHSFVVDPAEYNERLGDVISKQCGGKVDYVFLTHGHYDHTLGSEKLKQATGAKVAISEEDAPMLTDGSINCSMNFYGFSLTTCPPDVLIKDGDIFKVGNMTVKAISTPGHSKGGMCYIVDDVIFAGDTLFKNSYGRFDLYGGSLTELMNSIKKLMELEGDFKVYTGHGDFTTLANKRVNNSYI